MRSENATPGRDRSQPSFIEAARRKQIIECAIETLAEVGYAKASLAEIARCAGISKSVILYHFDGKDALIEAVVTEIYTEGFMTMFPRIVAEPTSAGKLRAYILTNLSWIVDHPAQIAALMQIFNGFRKADGTPRYTAEENEPQVGGLELLLKEGQELGEFRSFDARAMALTIRAAIDQLPFSLESAPGVDPGVYAEQVADIFDFATRRWPE